MYDDKQKFQGNWKCCDCDKDITELPFKPKNTENLRCLDCHKKNSPKKENKFKKQAYNNNGKGWPCSECGNNITELPFDPRDTSTLKCKDCFRK